MPASVTWLVPEKLLLATYVGRIQRKDVERVTHASCALLQALPRDQRCRVHMLMDVTDVQSFALPVMEVVKLHSGLAKDPFLGSILTFGNGAKWLETLAATLNTVLRLNMRVFGTYHAAISFLERADRRTGELPLRPGQHGHPANGRLHAPH